jgi:hypothetical protein
MTCDTVAVNYERDGGFMGQSSPSASPRRPLPFVNRRSPVDVLQELALRSPEDFIALTLIAKGLLERLQPAS